MHAGEGAHISAKEALVGQSAAERSFLGHNLVEWRQVAGPASAALATLHHAPRRHSASHRVLQNSESPREVQHMPIARLPTHSRGAWARTRRTMTKRARGRIFCTRAGARGVSRYSGLASRNTLGVRPDVAAALRSLGKQPAYSEDGPSGYWSK
jgi:hypothetical protein